MKHARHDFVPAAILAALSILGTIAIVRNAAGPPPNPAPVSTLVGGSASKPRNLSLNDRLSDDFLYRALELAAVLSAKGHAIPSVALAKQLEDMFDADEQRKRMATHRSGTLPLTATTVEALSELTDSLVPLLWLAWKEFGPFEIRHVVNATMRLGGIPEPRLGEWSQREPEPPFDFYLLARVLSFCLAGEEAIEPSTVAEVRRVLSEVEKTLEGKPRLARYEIDVLLSADPQERRKKAKILRRQEELNDDQRERW